MLEPLETSPLAKVKPTQQETDTFLPAGLTRIMLRICSATTPTLPSPMAVVSHCGAAEGAVLALRTGQAGVEASCRLAQCDCWAGQS